MEVLAAPLGCLFTGVSAGRVSVSYQSDRARDLLEHGEVTLSADTGVVVDEAVRVLHDSSAALIPVLADSDTEAEVGVVRIRTLRCGGKGRSRMAIESLNDH